jgi:ATP-binding cassette subfamily C protein CydC
MRAFVQIARLLVRSAPWAIARGALLALLVLLMGSALLGLSGWFITAAGMAGLAGIGIAFDVFRPSAGVRFLALGRTAARYGERLLTHDSTLRAIAALRIDLLRRQLGRGIRAMEALRSEAMLTRIVSDVDALDGIILRLLLPTLAALLTHAIVFVALGWLAGWTIAATILILYVPFATITLVWLARRALTPSRLAEDGAQHLRRGMIDMIRDRETLIMTGLLAEGEDHLVAHEQQARCGARQLDRFERNAGLALSLLTTLAAGATLLVGALMLQAAETTPALAAIGVFVVLALAETVQPLRRGAADYGRMQDAAQRVLALGSRENRSTQRDVPRPTNGPLLEVQDKAISLSVEPGVVVALTGPSGSGKTTLLLKMAGLLDAGDTQIAVQGLAPNRWDEGALRNTVGLLPQRSALMAGTVRENLMLACETDDTTVLAALDAVLLSDEIRERGGLDLRLGESGSGLSGGQARRLCLARLLLRRPHLLLLDEPLEGLDEELARRVLVNIRKHLPEAGILICLHRHTDEHLFDRKYSLVR